MRIFLFLKPPLGEIISTHHIQQSFNLFLHAEDWLTLVDGPVSNAYFFMQQVYQLYKVDVYYGLCYSKGAVHFA
jgi:hypothetical protein